MIAISWVFLAAAIATLIVGVFQDLIWVWISIGASVLALIFLLAGILRRKPVQPATAGAPYGPSPEEAAARGRPAAAATAAPAAPPAAPARAPAPERRPAPTPAASTPAAPTATPAPPPARKAAAKKTAAKKPAAKKTAAKKPAAKKTAAKKTAAASTSSRSTVVAIPERGTFHKADCRYVKDRDDTERVQLGTARTRGYTACGVCKPESS